MRRSDFLPDTPCPSGYATCLPSPLVRGLPACVRSTRKVRPSSNGPGSLHHALALALVVVVAPSRFPSRIHLPVLLRSTPVTALLRYYEDSDFSPRSVSPGALPDSPTQTSDRSVSNHPRVHLSRFVLTLVPSAPGLFPSD